MKPLTREEVATWPPLGPMNLDPARVLALLDERDAACADAARLREAFEKAIPWIGAGHANGDKESCSACDRIAAARKILAGADSTWLAERDAKSAAEALEAEARTWEIALDEGAEPRTRCEAAIQRHDARVRAAVLKDTTFIAAALEVAKVEALEAAAEVVFEHPGDEDGRATQTALAAAVRALKEKPAPAAKSCDVCGQPSTCGSNGDYWCRACCPDCMPREYHWAAPCPDCRKEKP